MSQLEEQPGLLLLELHSLLLAASNLPDNLRLGLQVLVQRLVGDKSPQPHSTAAEVVVALGRCCILTSTLQHQLSDLVSHRGLLDALVTLLDAAAAAQDATAAAALLRATNRLAQLPPASATPALADVWSSAAQRSRLLHAACASPEAGHAVASLAVTAALQQLPAAKLLQDLPLQKPQRAPAVSAKAWLATGLQPLLQFVQHRLCEASYTRTILASTQQKQQQGHQPQEQQVQEQLLQQVQAHQQLPTDLHQLWLLLCAAMGVADGHLLDGPLMATVHDVFHHPAVTAAVQAALFTPGLPNPAVQACHHPAAAERSMAPDPATTAATAAGGGGRTRQAAGILHVQSASGLFELKEAAQTTAPAAAASDITVVLHGEPQHHPIRLQLPTLALLRQVSVHSLDLSKHCFSTLAQIVIELLIICSSSGDRLAPEQSAATNSSATPTAGLTPASAEASSTPAQPAQTEDAVLRLWQQLLVKGSRSFPGMLGVLIRQWLPTVTATLAASAPPTMAQAMSAGVELQQQQQRAHAAAAAFVPLAWAVENTGRPLLQQQPELVLAAVSPHVPALIRLLQANTAASDAAGAAASAAAALVVPAKKIMIDRLILTTIWLLHAWLAALQQQVQQQQQCVRQQHPMPGEIKLQRAQPGAQSTSSAGVQVDSPEGDDDCSWSRVLASLATLVAADSMDTSWQHCRTAAVQLARTLLALQPSLLMLVADSPQGHSNSTLNCIISHSDSNNSSSTSRGDGSGPDFGVNFPTATTTPSTAVNAPSASVAHTSAVTACPCSSAASSSCSGSSAASSWHQLMVLPECWHQLLSTLTLLFARSTVDPLCVAKRQLLRSACQLLGDLMQHLGPTRQQHDQQQQQQQRKAEQQHHDHQQLLHHLGVLRRDLSARKLVRSCSKEELLHAVVEVMEHLHAVVDAATGVDVVQQLKQLWWM